jgi:predicted TIM-barrel fold metal-dependent hydrolase
MKRTVIGPISMRRVFILGAGFCCIALIVLAGKVLMTTSRRTPIYVPEPSAVAKKYADLTVIDVHNHDAVGAEYRRTLALWDAYSIDQVVLFAGNITDPKGVAQDEIAWKASLEHPERILPFFAGFDVHSKDSLAYIEERFEQGFVGIGEYVGASYAKESAVYHAEWKPKHPMDGYFPEVYALCAQYKAPILLHIDPASPESLSVRMFEEALSAHPETTFIYAHANAFNTPENLERLLEKYPNLYIDFFPAFNSYNAEAKRSIEEYLPLIERYYSRFLVSSDSGYGIEYYQAYEAIYSLLDRISENAREHLAHKNFEYLIEQRMSADGVAGGVHAAASRCRVPLGEPGYGVPQTSLRMISDSNRSGRLTAAKFR